MGSKSLTMQQAGMTDLKRSAAIRRPRCGHEVVMSDGEIGRCYLPQGEACRSPGCPGQVVDAVQQLGTGPSIETGDAS